MGNVFKLSAKRKNLLIWVFVITVVLATLATGINILKGRKAETKNSAVITEPEKASIGIPEIIDTDIFGAQRRTSDYRGNYIYVQFIKQDGLQNLLSINRILEIYKKRNDFKVIFITEIKEDLKNYFLSEYEEFIVDKNYDRYIKLFNAPTCCESFYLYDKSGKLIRFSYYYGNDEIIKTILGRNIDNKRFDIKEYLSLKRGDNKNNLIETIKEYLILSNNKYHLIFLTTRICSSCRSGAIIDKINVLYRELKDHPITFVLLLKDHTNKDIDNLKEHFNIKYPVFSAEKETDLLWRELINEYGNGYVTDIVVLMGRYGNILRVLEPGCNCDSEYFSKIKDELKNESL
jgi:hypothetical protein